MPSGGGGRLFYGRGRWCEFELFFQHAEERLEHEDRSLAAI
jgi:hypothetical protein